MYRTCVLKTLSPRGRLRKTRWVRPIHNVMGLLHEVVAVVNIPTHQPGLSFWGVTPKASCPCIAMQATRLRNPCLQHSDPCVLLLAGSCPYVNSDTYLNRARGRVSLSVSSLGRKSSVLSANFAGNKSARASGSVRLLPLQTYVSEVGGLHRQCKNLITLQVQA